MQTMDNATFKRKLGSVTRSINTQKENIQELIEAGLQQVIDSGNTVYLSAVLNACVGTKALPTKAMKEYINLHCSNLKWGKNKDGNMVFSKAIKGTDCVVTEPSEPWYAFTKAAQAKPDFNELVRAKSFLTSLKNAMKAHNVKDEAKAKQIADALEAVLAA